MMILDDDAVPFDARADVTARSHVLVVPIGFDHLIQKICRSICANQSSLRQARQSDTDAVTFRRLGSARQVLQPSKKKRSPWAGTD